VVNTNKHTLIFEVSRPCQTGGCGHSCDHSLLDQLEFKPGREMPDVLHDGCLCTYRPKTYKGTRELQHRPIPRYIEDLRSQLTEIKMSPQKRRHLQSLLSYQEQKAERSHRQARTNQAKRNRKTWF